MKNILNFKQKLILLVLLWNFFCLIIGVIKIKQMDILIGVLKKKTHFNI